MVTPQTRANDVSCKGVPRFVRREGTAPNDGPQVVNLLRVKPVSISKAGPRIRGVDEAASYDVDWHGILRDVEESRLHKLLVQLMAFQQQGAGGEAGICLVGRTADIVILTGKWWARIVSQRTPCTRLARGFTDSAFY